MPLALALFYPARNAGLRGDRCMKDTAQVGAGCPTRASRCASCAPECAATTSRFR